MKKLIIAIITTLVLLGSGIAFAQHGGPEGWKERQHRPHHAHKMPMPERVFRSFRRLNLDESQKAEMKNIFQTMRDDLKPVIKEMKAGKRQMKALISAASIDEQAIEAIAQREGALTTERVMITSLAMSEAFKLLTDEQRAELKELNEERRKRRNENRQKGSLKG